MMARQAVAHNGDEILPYNPVPHQSSNPSAVAVKPRLDLKPYAQQCKTKSRKLGNARVWMESSFVGTQPILSPETPSGDLAMFVFDDPSLLNGDADPSNLVPMVKLRSGSAQLDAYVVQRELDARKNGHLQSKKASSMSEQNLLLTQKHWSAQGKGLGTISKSRHHHCSDQGFQHHHPSSSSEPEPLSMQPEKENAVAIAAAMLTEGLNKRMMFAVDPDDFKPITSSSSSKPGETPEPTRRGSTSLDDVLSSLLALPPSPASANNNKNAVEDNDHHHHHFGSSSVLGRSGSLRRPTSQPDLDQQRRSKSPVIHEGGGAAGAYSWRKQENGTLAATAGTEGTNKVKMRHESLGDQTTRSKSPSLLDADHDARPGRSPEPYFFEDLEIKVMPKDSDGVSVPGTPSRGQTRPGSPQALSNILIQCRNSRCSNSCLIEEAQQAYKPCRNCHTFYCSRECRRAHRPKHVMHCSQLKASSLLTELMHQVRDFKDVYLQVSKVARQGYASRGFGCVKLFFQTVEDLEEFLESRQLDKVTPGYLAVQDLLPEEIGTENFHSLVDMCHTYNADARMVLYAAVCIWSQVPGSENTKFERLLVVKCAKMKLSPALNPRQQSQNATGMASRVPRVPAINPLQLRQEAIITKDVEDQETLIIASQTSKSQKDRILVREVVESSLAEKGVDLATNFRDIAAKLDAWVDVGAPFGHVVFYPQDSSRNTFMCIIMLELEEEKFKSLPRDIPNIEIITIPEHP